MLAYSTRKEEEGRKSGEYIIAFVDNSLSVKVYYRERMR